MIDNLPEFQKDAALKSYKGIRIKWPLELISLSVKGNLVDLNFYSKEGTRVSVSCTVKIEDYPELKLIKSGHGSWVSGKISDILMMRGYITLQLTDCLLEID